MQTTGKNVGEEMSQMASHLLAELFDAQDRYRSGRMSEEKLRERVGAIRKRAALAKRQVPMFEHRPTVTVVSSISDITEQWRGLFHEAEGLQQVHGEMVTA
jgi:hypothetical protein